MSGHPNERQVYELEIVVRDLAITRNKISSTRSTLNRAQIDLAELQEQERDLTGKFIDLLAQMDITPGNAGFEARMLALLEMYKEAVIVRKTVTKE